MPVRSRVRGGFAAIADRLLAEPLVLVLPDGTIFRFTYQLLIANALGAMYDSSIWLDVALFLAALEDVAVPAVLGARLQAFWDRGARPVGLQSLRIGEEEG
jgi:hypothetical protein